MISSSISSGNNQARFNPNQFVIHNKYSALPSQIKTNTDICSLNVPTDQKKFDPLSTKAILTYLGFMAVGIIAFKGLKKIFGTSESPKVLIDEITARTAVICRITEETLEKGNSLLTDFKSDFAEMFTNIKCSPVVNIYDSKRLDEAKTVKDFLDMEELFISSIENSFNKDLDKVPEKMEDIFLKYSQKRKEFRDELGKLITPVKQTINELIDIPQEMIKGKRAQEITGSFKYFSLSKTVQLDEFYNKALKSTDNEALARAGFENELLKNIADKHILTEQILKDIRGKIEPLIEQKGQILPASPLNVNMDIIPATMPRSIMDNPFYQFVQHTDFNDQQSLIKNSASFTDEMSNKLSLKDIDTIIQRMRLRQDSSFADIYEFGWYQNTIEKMIKAKKQIELMLKAKIASIPEDVNPDEVENLIRELSQHSEKFGYKTIGEMFDGLAKEYPDLLNTHIYETYRVIKPSIIDGNKFYNWLIDSSTASKASLRRCGKIL